MDRPTMMSALLLEALGGPDHLVLGKLPVPDPAPGEVLVQVATVAANRQDIVTASGRFPNPDLVLPAPDQADPGIASCRLSHRASSIRFAARHVLGWDHIRVYDTSWTEWGSSVGMPIERDPEVVPPPGP